LAKQARKIRLSPTRKRWAQQHGGHTFTGKPLNPPDVVEAKYHAAMQRMVRQMSAMTERELRKLYRTPEAPRAAMDASFASMAAKLIKALQRRFNVLFSDRAGGLAEALVKGISRQSAVGLKGSLKDASGGVTLKTDVLSGAVADVVKASIKANVALIKSIPAEYFLEIEGEVMRSIQSGRGMADLQPFLEKRYGITKKRAALIARDQTSKATTAINRARMEGLGVKKFKWLHSGGGKEPRPLHKNVLNGNVYSFDDPPIIDERTGERGLPGQLINCRCRMVPVIEFKAEGAQ
jgi:SPP1 gp7 family putative phage head morphogenesis protein